MKKVSCDVIIRSELWQIAGLAKQRVFYQTTSVLLKSNLHAFQRLSHFVFLLTLCFERACFHLKLRCCKIAIFKSLLIDLNDIWQKFEIHPGFQMPGLSVQPLSYPSLLSCLSVCLTTGCVNVNYYQQDERCETGAELLPSSLEVAKGVVHYRQNSAL